MMPELTFEPGAAARVAESARAFSVAKVKGQVNEDAWQRSRKGIGAMSDGASVSFDSAAWARILVRRYARVPDFDAAWVDGAVADFAKLHNRNAMPWMQQAAFDRGSFASLLGVRFGEDGSVRVLTIGDSIAVLCDGDRIVSTFPYDSPEQFDARPQLLSTNAAENEFLREFSADGDLSIEWSLAALDRPSLLCVTDALGRWILASRNDEASPIATLRRIATPRQFGRFVAAERAAGRIQRDDTTLLAYWNC